MDDFTKFKEIQQTAFELYQSKNHTYGNSYKECGKVGILVRLKDKINRAVKILEDEIKIVDNESLDDSIIDLMNYCNLFLMESNYCNKQLKNNQLKNSQN